MSRTPGLPLALAIGAPLAAFLALVIGAVCIALAFAGTSGCETDAPIGSVPTNLIPVYRGASAKFELGPEGPSILAAINDVETDFGRNLGTSSAGARGWMQFMPETWEIYGVDADGNGVRDPSDPKDAIYAAARYLRASGAPQDWHGAILAYNHAEWYVAEVLGKAHDFREAGNASAGGNATVECSAGAQGDAMLDRVQRLFSPRDFKALPASLWVGGGPPGAVDSRIWPDAVWLLERYGLRVVAARESGHLTHGDGTAMDMVPASGHGWNETARQAAEDLGWTESCGRPDSATACPLVPAIQFVGYNGYPGHGDPSHTDSPHLHASWKSSAYGCPGLCEPREWVMIFPLD
ncbi:MAG TPA: lytic transglycosylase domain-containing protein [Solirubrobacterales bacterium]|nr:lytic transglycosylase domain-containing protein [Solirubrobacterales bacterium]